MEGQQDTAQAEWAAAQTPMAVPAAAAAAGLVRHMHGNQAAAHGLVLAELSMQPVAALKSWAWTTAFHQITHSMFS